MAESSWPASEVTQEYLQELVSKGYMIVAEFVTCLVLVGTVSRAPTEGFVMVCAAFYERGFGLPSHQFLHALLWSYGLELQHLTPSGILHIVAFVTPCEAYIVIEPPLNLSSHFFQAQLWHDSGMGAASLGSVDILSCSGPRADSYFSIPQPDPPVGWKKAWFLPNDGASVPLPSFTGGCPIPHPSWLHGVAQIDFS
jgi:hypothetical protein